MTTKVTRRAAATLCVLFSMGVNAPAFAQTGWSTGIAAVPLPSGGSSLAPLVVGPAGDAIAASSVFAAGVNTLFVARFNRITATWTAAVPIASGPGVAYGAAAIDGIATTAPINRVIARKAIDLIGNERAFQHIGAGCA